MWGKVKCRKGWNKYQVLYITVFIGGSKGGARDAPPPAVQILSISCSFWEKYGQIIASFRVGTPSSAKSWIRHWYSRHSLKTTCHYENSENFVPGLTQIYIYWVEFDTTNYEAHGIVNKTTTKICVLVCQKLGLMWLYLFKSLWNLQKYFITSFAFPTCIFGVSLISCSGFLVKFEVWGFWPFDKQVVNSLAALLQVGHG